MKILLTRAEVENICLEWAQEKYAPVGIVPETAREKTDEFGHFEGIELSTDEDDDNG